MRSWRDRTLRGFLSSGERGLFECRGLVADKGKETLQREWFAESIRQTILVIHNGTGRPDNHLSHFLRPGSEMSDERNESYRRLGQHNTNKSKPSGWKETALLQGLSRTFFFSLFKTQRIAIRNEITNIATLYNQTTTTYL